MKIPVNENTWSLPSELIIIIAEEKLGESPLKMLILGAFSSFFSPENYLDGH